MVAMVTNRAGAGVFFQYCRRTGSCSVKLASGIR